MSFHNCDYTLNCGFISYFNFTMTFFSSEAVTGKQLAMCENFNMVTKVLGTLIFVVPEYTFYP